MLIKVENIYSALIIDSITHTHVTLFVCAPVSWNLSLLVEMKCRDCFTQR